MPEVFASANITLTPSGDPPLFNVGLPSAGNLANNVGLPDTSKWTYTVTTDKIGGSFVNGGANNNAFGAYQVNPNYTYIPNYVPAYTPYYNGTVNVQPAATVTLQCPHCQELTQLTGSLACTKCYQPLVTPNPSPFTFTPYTTGIPFANDLPGANFYPQVTPAVKPPAPAPAPAKPKEPDAHPGDGSRWEDI